ncbi:TetR/AcrR family transcriptional regulator, partial [Acinetobacter baumannii]|nr:TetR/AcrR family transcriptional regulator [Acinetobacter baumannii]
EYAMNHHELLNIITLIMMTYVLIHSSIATTMNFITYDNMGFTFEELVDCLINITMSYIADDIYKVA